MSYLISCSIECKFIYDSKIFSKKNLFLTNVENLLIHFCRFSLEQFSVPKTLKCLQTRHWCKLCCIRIKNPSSLRAKMMSRVEAEYVKEFHIKMTKQKNLEDSWNKISFTLERRRRPVHLSAIPNAPFSLTTIYRTKGSIKKNNIKRNLV